MYVCICITSCLIQNMPSLRSNRTFQNNSTWNPDLWMQTNLALLHCLKKVLEKWYTGTTLLKKSINEPLEKVLFFLFLIS